MILLYTMYTHNPRRVSDGVCARMRSGIYFKISMAYWAQIIDSRSRDILEIEDSSKPQPVMPTM